MSKFALTGGKLIDGTGGEIRSETGIVVEDSKIIELSQRTDFDPDVLIVDVSGKTIMPGMIDSHNHMAPWHVWLVSHQGEYLMKLAGKTVYFLKATLEAGCTAVRDMGGLEAGWVEAQREGLVVGPRLQTSVILMQPTNGLTDNMTGLGGTISKQGLFATSPGLPSPWADGPWEVRKKVREALRYGADIIKVANSDADLTRTLYSQEELNAIVEEAHLASKPVGCHVESLEGIMPALRAGVDAIEHCFYLDDESAALMAKQGTWLVTSLANMAWHAESNPVEEFREGAKVVLEAGQKTIQLAMKEGVRIAMGTDMAFKTGIVGNELKRLVDAGMSPMDAIVAGTKSGAECMGLQDEIGTLEVGKEADLLVVDGDPLADIAVLDGIEKLSLVIQAGKPISGPMITEFPWQPMPQKVWF
jgi:imidazolonepropionase-like amidohydrolase